jgi:hypothetical protein
MKPVCPGWHRPAERQLIRPTLDVDISTHREYRRDCTQACNNFRPADIAGVNDKLSAGKRIQSLRAQQAVSIGQNTDDRCFARRFFMNDLSQWHVYLISSTILTATNFCDCCFDELFQFRAMLANSRLNVSREGGQRDA